MKNIFYIVCLVLFLVSSIDAREVSQLEKRNGLSYEPNKEEPFTGKYVTYWDDGHGQKKREGTIKEGKLDGLWTYWYENGQKKGEINHKEGYFDGLWTGWYENGQKGRERNYKEGKLDGLWTDWDENGNVTKTKTYSNGELVE